MSILQELSIFKGLTEADIEDLGKIIEEKVHDDGTALFHEGDESDAFYIIKSGAVRIVGHNDDGDQVELAVLKPGDFFGEMGMIQNTPRNADAIISSDTTLLIIEKNEFHQFMAVNPKISMKVMNTFAHRHKRKQEVMDDDAKADGIIIGLFSATGGVGASFVAANIAAALKSLTKKKVLTVDLDLMFGDQGGIYDVKNANSVSLLINEQEIGFASLKDIIDETPSGVHLLQAPQRPEDAEAVTPNLILTCLEILKDHYDYIICDTANAIQEFNINLIESVQVPLYLLTPEILSVKNASRWLKVMEMIRYPTEDVKFVLNKYTVNDSATVKYIGEQFHKEILGTIPYNYELVRESLNKGKLLVQDYPDDAIGEALRKIAGKVAGIEVEKSAEKPFWKRWIGV